ncbi:MAG TPA: hypothetical protein DCS55_20965 [Acidimicrobiaceae bacterium]|nr:hypothetical protein [Acidimicrobiaceae bacterium]
MTDPSETDRRAQYLARVTAELESARDLEDVQRIVSTGARRLVAADGAAFVLRDGDKCAYLDEDAIAPLWKGRRFPMDACVSGWVMHEQRPAIVADVFADDRIPQEIYRPTFVRSAAVVPIRPGAPVGAIAVYWGRLHVADTHEIDSLQSLAECAAAAMPAA